MKAQRINISIALHFLFTSVLYGVGGQCHSPAAPPPPPGGRYPLYRLKLNERALDSNNLLFYYYNFYNNIIIIITKNDNFKIEDCLPSL